MRDREDRERRKPVVRPVKEDNVVKVTFENYDGDNWFVMFEKNGENIAIDLRICEFAEEMNYWNFPTKPAVKDERAGFAIARSAARSEIEAEIGRFIRRFNLGKCDL